MLERRTVGSGGARTAGGLSGVVCDDAPGFRLLMSALLREAGIVVRGSGECWDDAERLAPGSDVVVLDLWMPRFDAAALGRVRRSVPRATLAVVTALEPGEAAQRCSGVAVDLILSKSDPPGEVAARIARHAAWASSG